MLRERAIRSLLVEEIAGLRLGAPGDDLETAKDPAGAADALLESAAREADDQREALDRAERRALLTVGVDWLALVVLFVFRDPATTFLPTGPTVETIFTLGVIGVAVHSGFRLGQLEKYRAARRAWEKLD